MSGMPLFLGGIGCLLGGMLTDRQVRYWGRRWGRTAQGFVAYGLGAMFFVLAIRFTTDVPGAGVRLPVPGVVRQGLRDGRELGDDHRHRPPLFRHRGRLHEHRSATWARCSPPRWATGSRVEHSTDGVTENWTAAIAFYAVMFAHRLRLLAVHRSAPRRRLLAGGSRSV